MENLSPFILTILGNSFIAIGIILIIFITKFILNKTIKYLEYITAITVGLLLGIIFLGFIPKLTENGFIGEKLGIFILLGILLFYVLELIIHWHHCKDLNNNDSCKSKYSHEHKNGILIFTGTIIHNAFHGIVLFSAFAVELKFGITLTIAILLHSIPQNIVNYIMNHKDPKYAYIAAIGGILGALLVYPFMDFLVNNKLYILAIITGGLLYTALADIFPEFNEKGNFIKKNLYLLMIVIGIFLFLISKKISHHENLENKHNIHFKLNLINHEK